MNALLSELIVNLKYIENKS